MITDEDLRDISKEPELAFAELVGMLWDRVQTDIANNQYDRQYKIGFISDVLAAAEVFEIQGLKDWKLPDPHDDDLDQYFQSFAMAANHFTTKARLRHRTAQNPYSVALDQTDKRKIHHFVTQIRDVIEAAGLPTDKHDSLVNKLNDFEREVDRTRTAFQQFGAVTIGVFSLIGEGFEKLEPARRWIDSAANLIDKAKQFEEASRPQLRPPEKPKQIARAEVLESFSSDLDEEIPF